MRVRIEIMVLHHNDSECRKGRKEGCWSVGSPNPWSGQTDEDADGWSLSRTQGGGMRIKEKEGVRPGAKRSNNIQPVARQPSPSAHAQFQFFPQLKKTGRVQQIQWDFFARSSISQDLQHWSNPKSKQVEIIRKQFTFRLFHFNVKTLLR
jgi:hypothetical protein